MKTQVNFSVMAPSKVVTMIASKVVVDLMTKNVNPLVANQAQCILRFTRRSLDQSQSLEQSHSYLGLLGELRPINCLPLRLGKPPTHKRSKVCYPLSRMAYTLPL